MSKTLRIGLLGLGVVGGGVVQVLAKEKEKLQKQTGVAISIDKALVRPGEDKSAMAAKYGFTLTTDFDALVEDESLDVIIELIGKVHPAKEFIEAALRHGKHVVTANKDLIAQHGVSLNALAKENKVSLFYEASVAGGIPILRTLTNNYLADEITDVMGIVNGTTNYMLTKMFEEHLSYQAALEKAQALGFAESDPTNDVDGIDAAYKMVILSQFAYGMDVTMDDLEIEGIRSLTELDVYAAKELGYEIKLIGRAKKYDQQIAVSVGPTLVHASHPIASIKNEFNGIFIESSGIHQSMFYGPGAGALPTATSVLSDVVAIAKNKALKLEAPLFNQFSLPTALANDEQQLSRYYLALNVKDYEQLEPIFLKYTIKVERQLKKDAHLFVICEPISKAKLKEFTQKLTNYARIERVMKVIGA
ncbi:homoserine dehydrogenase [Enterococcus columbae]|uniref:Homoserine dehydrogenase n=1 Tax=Enterococcus columbae DSM 7374 = ATCC 51263 TaxID=1121865 RepID=S0KT42_9ENTE|nr:homoserine dehydrogenase [Enterococcus columbae]EOT44160.1 hypothetical protein OMW_00214 [Enterococcus columbae DSM 7374 = ATCC 51263]EOW84318.1 hypothetical protein I568_00812 [Enterococcus columbae DSM 7374 = ATCC 51263]OJG26124.1 hypothetical protein RR47_GL000922 [Enterococcus columbae DSM 7374 = ATCC 51263]